MIDRMTQVGTLSTPADTARPLSGQASRAARFRANLYDFAALIGGTALALLIASAYLLVRTGWGATDVGDADSAIAAALLLTIPPTWIAWQLISVSERAATPGQRRAHLRVEVREDGWPGARQLRTALHPLTIPIWLWLAALVGPLLAVPIIPLVILVWILLVAVAALSSLVLFAVRPGAPAVHDWVARTKVVVGE